MRSFEEKGLKCA
jgi:hypothetical protein